MKVYVEFIGNKPCIVATTLAELIKCSSNYLDKIYVAEIEITEDMIKTHQLKRKDE
jgi:hypothetical protein